MPEPTGAPGGEQCMSVGRTMACIGAGIAISVGAAFAVNVTLGSYQSVTDHSQDDKIKALEGLVRDGLYELRTDVKELLKRGR